MSAGDIGFLCLVVGALSLFAGVLGWASWMESREAKRKSPAAQVQNNVNDKTTAKRDLLRASEPQASAKIVTRAL